MATTDHVTLINAFEVPREADESFIAGWERARGFLATREGFAATALHLGLPLVTHNPRDFTGIQDLTIITEAPMGEAVAPVVRRRGVPC